MNDPIVMWSNQQQLIASGIFPDGRNTHMWPNVWSILDVDGGPNDLARIVSALDATFHDVDGLRSVFPGTGNSRICVEGDEPRFTISSRRELASADDARRIALDSVFFAADLESGPLAWAEVFRMSADSWVVLIVFDHVVADGYAFDLFERAFLGRMRDGRSGAIRPSMPAQRALAGAEERRSLLRHYEELFALDFAGAEAFETTDDVAPNEHEFVIEGEQYRRLEALAGRLGTTVAQVPQLLLVHWASTLSDRTTFVGAAHHGRKKSALALVADLASYDFVAVDPRRRPMLADTLQEIRETPHLWGAFWPGEVGGYREAQRRLSFRLNVVPRGRTSLDAAHGSGPSRIVYDSIEKIDWDDLVSGPYQPHDAFVPYVHVWVEPDRLVGSVFTERPLVQGPEMFEEPFSVTWLDALHA